MSLPLARRTAGMAIAPLVAVTLAQALPAAQFHGALDVVEITATVTDGKGRFLTGLRESDFAVREDGVPQRLIRVDANREQITDATGGRTEMVQRPDHLTAAMDRIAAEPGRYVASEGRR